MRIAFGTDDDNECVQFVLRELHTHGDVVVFSGDDVAWPDFGRSVASAVAEKQADVGVLMCWTGTGTAIAANKVPGVRAAVAWDPWIAGNARAWNDANVLTLSTKRLAPDVAVECVRAFLSASFDHDESENVAKLD